LSSIENEGTHNFKLLLTNFLYRVKSEIEDIHSYIKDFADFSSGQLKELSKSTNMKDALKMFSKN
jgi:hypothetical protein